MHSSLSIDYKYSFEEILDLRCNIFKFLLFCYCSLEVEIGIIALFVDLWLHVVPFERVLGKEHKVEKDTHSPYINRNSIIWVTYNLWCHVFLCPAMSLGPRTPDRSRETEICNLVPNIIRIFVFVIFLY